MFVGEEGWVARVDRGCDYFGLNLTTSQGLETQEAEEVNVVVLAHD